MDHVQKNASVSKSEPEVQQSNIKSSPGGSLRSPQQKKDNRGPSRRRGYGSNDNSEDKDSDDAETFRRIQEAQEMLAENMQAEKTSRDRQMFGLIEAMSKQSLENAEFNSSVKATIASLTVLV